MNRLRFIAKAMVHGALDLFGDPHRQRVKLRGKLVILTYHSFSETWPKGLFNSLPIERFERQLRFLRRNFRVVSLEEGLRRLSNGDVDEQPWLAVTIDDGFADNYTLAWPVLRRYEVPATIFLATDFLDTGRPPWPTQIIDVLERTEAKTLMGPISAPLKGRTARANAAALLKRRFASLAPQERFAELASLRRALRVVESNTYLPLTWRQVREMSAAGVRFGSHTCYHSILPMVERTIATEELLASKERVEAELQLPCTEFAYPDGKHNPSTAAAVLACGYDVALTQDLGFNQGSEHRLALRRVEVPWHDPLQTFRCRTSLSLT